MLKENHKPPRTRYKSAIRRNRFRQRTGPDIDTIRRYPKVLICPASVFTQRSARMRLVYQKKAAEFLFYGDQLWKWADIPVHREHTVGNDERTIRCRPVLQFMPQ